MCIWKAKHYRQCFYIKCRKDEQFSGGEEDVKVKPLQWSLSAAAGAQFKITENWVFMRSRELFITLMTAVM